MLFPDFFRSPQNSCWTREAGSAQLPWSAQVRSLGCGSRHTLSAPVLPVWGLCLHSLTERSTPLQNPEAIGLQSTISVPREPGLCSILRYLGISCPCGFPCWLTFWLVFLSSSSLAPLTPILPLLLDGCPRTTQLCLSPIPGASTLTFPDFYTLA